MNTLTPFIPTSIWLIAAGIAITVLLVTLMLYLFNYRRISQITNLGGTVADLIAKNDIAKSDYEAIRNHIISQKEELLRIDGERQEQETLRLELDKLTQKVQEMDKQNQSYRDEVGRLELEKQGYAEQMRQMTDEMQTITQQRNTVEQELKALEETIPNRKKQIAEELIKLNDEHKKKLAEQIQKFDDKLNAKKEAIKQQKRDFEELQKDIQDAKSQQRKAHEKVTEAEIYLQVIGTESENKKLYLTDLDETIDSMRRQKKKIEEEIQENLKDLSEKKNRLLQTEDRLAEFERAISRLETEEDLLQNSINNLRKELDQNGVEATHKGSESYSDLLVEPACLNSQEFFEDSLRTDEIQALQKFQDHLENEQIVFPKRIIYSFHTSLKCAHINPLTVLAGVSGTGKTLLPIKYARLMGMHSLVMAVQPRWDSPQDMFGFYNYLEKQYKATDLSRALMRMDKYNSFEGILGDNRNRMLLVLMDEMNLARTEYYFSEFLSKLELRRDVNDPSDPSDRERAEVVLDLGPGGTEDSRLWVGDNILFVGTMNEDETTQTLSDKVIDRSNVLRFGKPAGRLPDDYNNLDLRSETAPGFLTNELWKEWVQDYNKQSSWCGKVADWTENINTALQKVGRPFGYRVEKAIRTYVANYPGVEIGQNVYKKAFADQIEQKILPKLRGLELSDNLTIECLGDMEIVISELGDTPLSDAFNNAKVSNNTNMFTWHGVSRI